MAAKKGINISFRKNSHMNKIWKTIFPKKFLEVGEHEYINISEIKFENKNILFRMAAKTNFVTLHNNADLF